MAVAAGLYRKSGHRLAGQICRHDGSRTAQESKRAKHHPPVALWHEFRNALRIALSQDFDGAACHRSLEIGVRLPRCLVAKLLALFEAFGARTQIRRHLSLPHLELHVDPAN